MHATERPSYGTVFYPASFFVLTLLLWDNHKAILAIAILVMAIADAVAAIIGENIAKPIQYRVSGEIKSLQGSLAMFVATLLIVAGGLFFFIHLKHETLTLLEVVWMSTIVAIVATACESISYKGSDNLTVPLGTAFTLHFLLTHSIHQNLMFSYGLLFALFIAAVSLRMRFLSGSGAVSTFLLGVIIFGTGNWEFSLPILLFFFLSSLLSKTGKKWKQKFADTFQKGGQRDIGQVLANGGIAGLIVLIWNYFPGDVWYFAFIGAVAAVTADTWATEIGVFSKKSPRAILNLKPVAPGTSGGISILGIAGALMGSFVIVFIGRLVTTRYHGMEQGELLFIALIFSGLAGSIVDSFLGATVQAQYQCPACGKQTEKKIHCGSHATKLISGFQRFDNDVVNAVCAFAGAIIAGLSYFAFN
ncbi:MAG: DUF92 domain-containing protein [Candidatus Zhuqueibacterota bacterium]